MSEEIWTHRHTPWCENFDMFSLRDEPCGRCKGRAEPFVPAGELEAVKAEKTWLMTHLRIVVGAIDNLIADSDGVGGLHLNGDFAPWSELQEGGRFEEWLMGLDLARAALPTNPVCQAEKEER